MRWTYTRRWLKIAHLHRSELFTALHMCVCRRHIFSDGRAHTHTQVTVMLNHCMSEQGMVEGFRFSLHAKANNQFIPMNRRMFFRHSMVECVQTPAISSPSSANSSQYETSHQENALILQLLLKQNEVKDKLVSMMQKIYKAGVSQVFFSPLALYDRMSFFFIHVQKCISFHVSLTFFTYILLSFLPCV
jgi:hypothetical protein